MNITRIEYSPCEEHGTKGCLYCTGGADSRLGRYKARVAELEAELDAARAEAEEWGKKNRALREDNDRLRFEVKRLEPEPEDARDDLAYARARALEEAAKVAEDRGLGDAFLEPHQLVKAIAAAIRALKPKP